MERRGNGIRLLAAALALGGSGSGSAAWAGPLDAPYVRENLAMPDLRNCAAQGPGFLAVPGSETCLRIGGRVRTEAGTRLRPGGAPVTASGRLAVDARTQTAYGPVRAFVRLRSAQP